MSYYIADQNGYVGDLASNNGLNELFDILTKYGAIFTTLEKDGQTEDINGLKAALKEVPNDNPTVKNFKRLVYQCAGILIISDGVE
jgi:hypothetical protein